VRGAAEEGLVVEGRDVDGCCRLRGGGGGGGSGGSWRRSRGRKVEAAAAAEEQGGGRRRRDGSVAGLSLHGGGQNGPRGLLHADGGRGVPVLDGRAGEGAGEEGGGGIFLEEARKKEVGEKRRRRSELARLSSSKEGKTSSSDSLSKEELFHSFYSQKDDKVLYLRSIARKRIRFVGRHRFSGGQFEPRGRRNVNGRQKKSRSRFPPHSPPEPFSGAAHCADGVVDLGDQGEVGHFVFLKEREQGEGKVKGFE
jgi:hypothetical protein